MANPRSVSGADSPGESASLPDHRDRETDEHRDHPRRRHRDPILWRSCFEHDRSNALKTRPTPAGYIVLAPGVVHDGDQLKRRQFGEGAEDLVLANSLTRSTRHARDR
jgi:hypothetical protein